MLFFNLINNPLLFIGFIIGILSAITVHEAAHAWTAYKLGDPTAKLEGRVTLNPLAHLDLFGTMMLFFVGFGWGKPVPVNIHNLKSKFDELKVALSGALSNFILAVVLSLTIRFIPMSETIALIIIIVIQLNIIIMIFNLLPIPPLDGSTVLKVILPEQAYATLRQMTPFLFIAFLVFIYSTPYFSMFISGFTNFMMQFLIGN